MRWPGQSPSLKTTLRSSPCEGSAPFLPPARETWSVECRAPEAFAQGPSASARGGLGTLLHLGSLRPAHRTPHTAARCKTLTFTTALSASERSPMSIILKRKQSSVGYPADPSSPLSDRVPPPWVGTVSPPPWITAQMNQEEGHCRGLGM